MGHKKLYLDDEPKYREKTAKTLDRAFNLLKDQTGASKTKLIKEFADKTQIGEGTILKWISAKRIPKQPLEVQFLSVVYLLARRTKGLGVEWLVDVLEHSDRALPTSPTEEDIRRLFKVARVNRQAISDEEIDAAVSNLFNPNQKPYFSYRSFQREQSAQETEEFVEQLLSGDFPEKSKTGFVRATNHDLMRWAIVVLLLVFIAVLIVTTDKVQIVLELTQVFL